MIKMSEYIPISDAAKLAEVSITSIRSWILEGYLEQTKVLNKFGVNKEQINDIIAKRREHPADWKKFCRKIDK